MKAFSSIRREIKALYKPRPAGISTKVELEGTSRRGSASTNHTSEAGLVESDYRNLHALSDDELEHELSPQYSTAREKAISPTRAIESDYRTPPTRAAHDFEHGVSSHRSTTDDEDSAPARPETFAPPSDSPTSEALKETDHAAEIALPETPGNEHQDESSRAHEEVEEEVPPLTFEQAQAARNELYLVYDGEDESDYTQGPARFVFAYDGVQQGGALLMTLHLSTLIKSAIHEQHAFEQAELAGLRQRQAFMRFEYKVEAEIANCRSKIAAARDVDPEKEAAVQDQLNTFLWLLEDVQRRRQTTHVHLETQAQELRNTQAAANELIEEAFICANLIADGNQDPSPKVEELDLETEYTAFCERLKHAIDDDGMIPAAPPLDTSRDYVDEIPILTEDERAHQDIINALWASKETLDQARRDFEQREIMRAQEYQANADAYDRNEPTADDSPEAFDIRWVKRYGELTRALIDAESAYAEVKRTAFEAGVSIPFMDMDNDTVFEGSHRDGVGYTVSEEQELVNSAPTPTVTQWLSKVPEDVSVGSPAYAPTSESDGWEAEEVGISDSVSLVAEGKERARIDRWRKACGVEKQE